MTKSFIGNAALLLASILCLLEPRMAHAQQAVEQTQAQTPPLPAATATTTTAAAPAPASTAIPGATSPALPPPLGAGPRAPGFDLSAEDPFVPTAVPEKTKEQKEVELRNEAFNAAITGLLPLRPDEIREVLERFDKTKQAVEVPVYPYPEPEVVVETVSLDPGVKPPEIKVAVGHVTTLTILDVTGEPWPIQDISWAGNFEVVEPEEGGNVVRITPMSDFAYGNVSVRLLKLKTPVTFTLKTHRDKVQYRFDARIEQFGPLAQPPILDGGITLVAGNATLSNILDGIPPADAVKLNVSGVDSRTSAYKLGEVTYVRTPLTLLSPGWSNSVASADGMNVYTVTNAPVLLLSDQGKMMRARLSEEVSDD